MGEGIMKNVTKKLSQSWGIGVVPPINDGSKYGAWGDESRTVNDLLGIVKVSQIKEAERCGAIVYMGKNGHTSVHKGGRWVIAGEWFLDPASGKKLWGVSRAYLKWREEKSGRHVVKGGESESVDSFDNYPEFTY